MRLSSLVLLAATTALAPVAMAADSAPSAADQAGFQPIPAVSTAATSESAHSTPSTTRYYYYPTYRYQPTTGQVTTGNQRYIIPTTTVTPQQTVITPRVITPQTLPRLATTPSLRQSLRGYVAARAAYSFPQDIDFGDSPTDIEITFSENFAGTAAAGLYLLETPNSRTRLELEAGYRNYEFDSVGGTTVNDPGSMGIMSGMANIYQDIALGPVRPYVGIGAGLAYVDFDNVFQNVPGPAVVVDGETTGLALQGMLGIEFAVANNLSLMLEGRRFGIYDLDFEDNTGSSVEENFITDEVSLGVRVNF